MGHRNHLPKADGENPIVSLASKPQTCPRSPPPPARRLKSSSLTDGKRQVSKQSTGLRGWEHRLPFPRGNLLGKENQGESGAGAMLSADTGSLLCEVHTLEGPPVSSMSQFWGECERSGPFSVSVTHDRRTKPHRSVPLLI